MVAVHFEYGASTLSLISSAGPGVYPAPAIASFVRLLPLVVALLPLNRIRAGNDLLQVCALLSIWVKMGEDGA